MKDTSSEQHDSGEAESKALVRVVLKSEALYANRKLHDAHFLPVLLMLSLVNRV